jgi:hypothetical protein
MATRDEITAFLQDFHQKMKIYDIFFRDERSKNKQLLIDLNIRPIDRKAIIESLKTEDYSDGPIPELLYNTAEMWIFGKEFNNIEIYIKITMGQPSSRVICISFHEAEHPLHYPLKGATI